jgi:aldose sugar dehydrogenase
MNRREHLKFYLQASVASAFTWTTAAAASTPLKAMPVLGGVAHPWSMAFLPDGRVLLTERAGRMRIVTLAFDATPAGAALGQLGAPLEGLPSVVAQGQGGLLDVALDPAHSTNRLVYWSYSEPGEGGAATAVARARLDGERGQERLADVRVIFRQNRRASGGLHFGSRLVFDRAGHLFVTLGDRYNQAEQAQTLDNHFGKIVRIQTDGSAPADNPFAKDARALPHIWSYGHRNVQGAALHPVTGALWAHEHGPQGGDELNLVQRGGNHGWPVITHGRNYVTGTTIGQGSERADIVASKRHWVPRSVAPSGMAFVTSARYPSLQGTLLIGTLSGARLIALKLDGDQVTQELTVLDSVGRIRDVRQAPDGWIYVCTDSAQGQIFRLA